jgi:hypothetical protein
MKENDIEERLRELKRLYDEGYLKDEDLIERLEEIVKRKESLKKSIANQKNINTKMVENFTLDDLLLLLNFEV